MDDDMFIKHAALILLQELGTKVHEARHKAYCEGPEGYARRLKEVPKIWGEEDA